MFAANGRDGSAGIHMNAREPGFLAGGHLHLDIRVARANRTPAPSLRHGWARDDDDRRGGA